MKEPVTRPEILTVDELTSFFAEVFKPKQFTFFLNLYGSGLCISEMIALRTSDIDGERMLLRVSNGNTLSHRAFDDLMDSCYQKDWVVYAKKPFGGVEGAFEYLGRYTHRIAMSNSRIVDTDDNCTTFTWKDYKDNASMKNMTRPLPTMSLSAASCCMCCPMALPAYATTACTPRGQRLQGWHCIVWLLL